MRSGRIDPRLVTWQSPPPEPKQDGQLVHTCKVRVRKQFGVSWYCVEDIYFQDFRCLRELVAEMLVNDESKVSEWMLLNTETELPEYDANLTFVSEYAVYELLAFKQLKGETVSSRPATASVMV